MREDTTDADLLAAHVAGDPSAFPVLIRRHRDRLWGVALRHLRNAEDAADALQEAYIAAFRRADSFRGQSRVTTWLHRIVVNACIDWQRSPRGRRHDPLPDDRPDPAVTTDFADDVADCSLLHDALQELPAEQRDALVLVAAHDWAVTDAARYLDVAPGTVKSRCARARVTLASRLGYLQEPNATSSRLNNEDLSS